MIGKNPLFVSQQHGHSLREEDKQRTQMIDAGRRPTLEISVNLLASGRLAERLPTELQAAAPSTAIAIDQVRNDKRGNDQSHGSDSPPRSHSPIQAAATAK